MLSISEPPTDVHKDAQAIKVILLFEKMRWHGNLKLFAEEIDILVGLRRAQKWRLRTKLYRCG